MDRVQRHRRMCTAKKARFSTAIEGRMYLARKQLKLALYRCPYCGGFHLTKKEARDGAQA